MQRLSLFVFGNFRSKLVLRTGCPIIAIQPVRHYVKGAKMPPTKHLDFKSGDLESLPQLDLSQPSLEYADVEEIDIAPEAVQRIVSLEFANRRSITQKHLFDIMREIQEHPADTRSHESRITRLTIAIRNQLVHCMAFRKDKISKVSLIHRIQERHRQLRLLQKRDKESFEWLTAKLGVVYTPTPEPIDQRKMSIKAVRIHEARCAMWASHEQKMEEFRLRLEAETHKFEEEKDRKLRQIEQDLKILGVDKMESVNQVIADMGLGEEHMIKDRLDPKEKRRDRILAWKFKLWAEREREKEKEDSQAGK